MKFQILLLSLSSLFCGVHNQYYSQNPLYTVSSPVPRYTDLIQPAYQQSNLNSILQSPVSQHGQQSHVAAASSPVGAYTELNDNSIDSVLSRVIEEATLAIEHSEAPVTYNNSHFGIQSYVGGHGGRNGHGMGGHNYCKFTPTTEKIAKISNVNIKAFEILTKRHNMPKTQVIQQLYARLPEFCHRLTKPLTCDRNSRYRTIDGTCNNLQNPYWGSTMTPFDRLAPSVYEDGWNEPRGAGKNLQGQRLPNVRTVSLSVHPDHVQPDSRMTNMIPQVGQFLDHDMTLTPESDKRCCAADSNNVDCWPIRLPADDYFFSRLRHPQTCMDFTRSSPYCFPHNAAGQREQMNIVTAFVDASHVYSSEDHRIRILRSYQGGRLRTNAQNPNFMPTVAEVQAATGEKFEFMGTFLGGEERVNEMPGLTVMHNLLFREHNRLADEISSRRPYWEDETIFQEARRILVAEWQNVIYGEYLPIILGDRTMVRYGLKLDDNNLLTTYNPSMDPSVFHAFADAAYRCGHTLINGIIRLMRGLSDVGTYKIRDNFFNHEQITSNGWQGYDLILGGLQAQNAQTYDPFITEDVTNFLLKEKEHDFGGDLIARNLQRAREHGLPSYNVYRQLCGMPGMTNSWASRPQNIPENVWQVLGSLYETPADIDLFTGGLAEVPVHEAVTGHTFNCLKALQFSRVRSGDRFFFTHSGQTGSFTPEQVREIRKRNLGDIICQNSNVEMTTRNVFKIPSRDNPMLYCHDPTRNQFNIEIFLYDRQ